jgi:hypothetical protein
MLGRLADLGRFRPIFSSLDASSQIIDVHWLILGVDRRTSDGYPIGLPGPRSLSVGHRSIVGKTFDVTSGVNSYPKIYVLMKNFGRLPAIVYGWVADCGLGPLPVVPNGNKPKVTIPPTCATGPESG